MGDFYEFKCEKCGFVRSFFLGEGFLSFLEDNKESEKRRDMFRKDVLDGMYGDVLKNMAIADHDGELEYHDEEGLYDCLICHNMEIRHIRTISSRNKKYRMKIEMSQNCSKCGYTLLSQVNISTISYCPKCMGWGFKVSRSGLWD